MSAWKKTIRKLFAHLGYDITKRLYDGLGLDAYVDMRRFLRRNDPVAFDIGANTGATVLRLKEAFPGARVFAFEPNADCFAQLQETAQRFSNVSVFPLALGRSAGHGQLRKTGRSEWSSFLEINQTLDLAEVTNEVQVDMSTLDQFAAAHAIKTIDVLKIDTQGYELEVLNGAPDLLGSRRVGLVYLEFTFADFYAGLPPFAELFELLTRHGLKLVSIYEPHYRDNLLAWTDLLFVNPQFFKNR